MRRKIVKQVNGALSQGEIDALLAGVDMSEGKSLVVTVYGHENVIDQLSVSSFEGHSGYYNSNSNAETYCDNINSLELKGNSWVFAKIISEHKPYGLRSFLPVKFIEMILNLDDRSLQKVLREFSTNDLAKAFIRASAKVKEKVFKNMSKRSVQSLKEDMDFMKNIGEKYVKESQLQILDVIHQLINNGEIVFPKIE